jgi:hypothetical protein
MELEMPKTRLQENRPDRRNPHDDGLVVALWLLALLIAEIELWTLVLAHMYRT